MGLSAAGRRSATVSRALLRAALWAALAGLSCATTPTSRASETEKLQCDATTLDAVALIRRLSIVSVSPLYVTIHSSTIGEVRTRGVRLLVRPPEGIDPYRLLRSLQCHTARVALGREAPVDPNDPFGHPGSWLDIDVQSESGNYPVSVSADSVAAGVQLLERAQAFADSRRLEQ